MTSTTSCSKRLRKEPEARYSSVAKLIDDIERYLAGRPVLARAPSLLYRSRKLVGRHRLATAIALALVLLTGLYMRQLRVERTRAQESAARAAQTASALESLLGNFDADVARGGQITVKELLDRSVEELGRQLEGQDQVQVRLGILIGNLYQRLGAYDEALKVLEPTLGTAERVYGQGHRSVARAALGIGAAHLAANRFRTAREPLERALSIFRQSGPEDAPLLSETLGCLSRLAWIYREHEKALELSAEALAIREAHFGLSEPEVVPMLTDRAEVLLAVDEPAAAVPLLERAVSTLEAAEGSEHPRLGIVLRSLGTAVDRSGDPARAVEVYARALAVSEAARGVEHPDTVAALVRFGEILKKTGEHRRAREVLTHALEVAEAVYGPDSPVTLRTLGGLVAALRAGGLPREALPLIERSLQTQERLLGEGSSHLVPTLDALGGVHRELGDEALARVQWQRALSLLEAGGSSDPDLAARLQGRLAEVGAAAGG